MTDRPPRSRLHRAAFTVLRGLFAPIAWAAAAVPIVLSAPPAALLLGWGWPRTPGGWLVGAMAKAALLFGSYIVYGLTLLLVTAALSRLLPLGFAPGRQGHESARSVFFVIRNVWILTARVLFTTFVRATPLMSLYYRGLGATVGRRVLINSVQVWDAPMLTLGDGAVIGGSSVVMGHYGDEGDLVIGEVKIGKRAVVGERAIVFPDTVIGDGAVLMAGSVLPPGSRVPPGERWQGVPAVPVGRDR